MQPPASQNRRDLTRGPHAPLACLGYETRQPPDHCEDRALYVGELAATGWHRHAPVALLVSLSGRFAVHLACGRLEHCRSALVDIGVDHVLDPCGEQVALVYLEPDAPEVRRWRPLLGREGGVLLDVALSVGARSAVEERLRAFDLPQLLRLPGDTARPPWIRAWHAACRRCAG